VKCGARDDPARRETLVDLYDSEIAYTDDFIARLFSEVVPGGPSLVVLHADHGEEFLEHGQLIHGRTLFSPAVRIPLVMVDPAGRWAGKTVSAPASLVDIYPTILDYLKIPAPPGLQGTSLLPLLEGAPSAPSRPIVCELEEEEAPRVQSVLLEKKRLIRGAGESNAGARHLFDAAQDPGEARDLLPAAASAAAALEAALEDWLVLTPRFHYTRREHRWTQEARDKLRALGYLK
jgi:arylsulfatase A-like enzyme